MEKDAQHWINRYIDAYMIVTRQINGRIRESIAEGVTNDQFQIMRLIDGQDQCTSTYLAESFAVGKSSITAIISRLVDAGLIERTRDENDRRQVYLSMTEQGRNIYETAEKQVHDVITPYLYHFEEKDIEMFVKMFEKLADLIQEPEGRNQ